MQGSAAAGVAAPACRAPVAQARAPPSARRQRRVTARAAAEDPLAGGLSWLQEKAADVVELTAAEAALAAADAADEAQARSVGLHLRGRSAFKEGVTNEDDPARFVYHRALQQAAVAGAAGEAESVLEEMSRAGNVPGPRAYHALVFAYVKARQPAGALAAIRRCWDDGITPLPETYAAVVAAHAAAGDLETAEAVCASNRRAGVDCTKAWQQLVAALFRAGQEARALEAYAQGEAEGLAPSSQVYEGLAAHLCATGDLEGAGGVLQQMRERGVAPTIQHYAPLIAAHAARGDPSAAYALMEQLLSGGAFPQGMQGVCETVLEAQLEATHDLAAASAAVQRMKAVMLANGMQPGCRFYAAQLRAALRLGDVLPAVQALRALRTRSPAPLTLVDDETLGQLLLQTSRAALPAELYEALSAMCREGRSMPPAALAPDATGCTVLGAWVRRRMEQSGTLQQQQQLAGLEDAAARAAPMEALIIDGVSVDPLTLFATDVTGAQLAVSRMGVRELRAELAARRAPVSGNKKELARRLQKLRQLDSTRSAPGGARAKADPKPDSRRKVAVVVTDRVWVDGKLVEEARYESEREVAEAAAEEEGEDGGEWDMEEGESEAAASRRSTAEEELDFDDDLPGASTWAAMATGGPTYMLASTPHFASPAAGAHEAASMVLGAVVDLGAQPSEGDLAAVASYVVGARDVPAATLLAAALDRQPAPVADTEALRAELAALAAEAAAMAAADFEDAVAGVLGERVTAETAEIEAEMAAWTT